MDFHAPNPLPPGRLTRWWAVALILTLLWERSGLDVEVMQFIGTHAGFPLQHAWWLERVLHQSVRQAASAAFAALWIWALWSARTLRLPRRDRVAVAVLVSLSLLAVNLIKNASLTSCPWDWRMFGGVAEPVAHWRWGVADGGPGRCFPGGHASSAFGFIALCLPWLAPPSGASRRTAVGFRWLAVVMLAGLVAGTVQTLRGAHPPSHTLWTLLICGGVSMVGWRLLQPWLTSPARVATASTPASP
jgi:membrane-associated PAP2 superfamily phosphatase